MDGSVQQFVLLYGFQEDKRRLEEGCKETARVDFEALFVQKAVKLCMRYFYIIDNKQHVMYILFMFLY